jgi:TetR/AcrR family transcriptional regulator, fatty acid metabolism regulator protein
MTYRTTSRAILRKQERRARLLTEATRLFGQRGFHDTTVPMIVAAADSSIGSFYLYFRSKEDIFAAVLEWMGAQIATAIGEAMAQAGPDPLDHMRAAVEALVNFLARNPGEARILIVESSGLGKRLEAVRRAIVQSHTRSVQQALTLLAHRLPEMDAAIAASCWIGAAYEAAFHWLEQPESQRVTSQHLAESIAAFNLRAIGAPVGGAES